MRNTWDRTLWGVRFKSREDAFLIGTVWAKDRNAFPPHPDEPSRALLFTTRKKARAWCGPRNAEYRARPINDVCHWWSFLPVRVRERVTVSEEESP